MQGGERLRGYYHNQKQTVSLLCADCSQGEALCSGAYFGLVSFAFAAVREQGTQEVQMGMVSVLGLLPWPAPSPALLPSCSGFQKSSRIL